MQKMIEDGVFQNIDSIFDIQKDASKFRPHICNERCKICTGPNEYRCRKWNNQLKIEDNNINALKKLTNDLPQHCIDQLVHIEQKSMVILAN